jgi:hypothetical protein
MSSLIAGVLIVIFYHRHMLHLWNKYIKTWKKRVTMVLVFSDYGLNHVLKILFIKVFSK